LAVFVAALDDFIATLLSYPPKKKHVV
jgi:hypothetical protein